MTRIEVDKLCLTYRVRTGGRATLKDILLGGWRSLPARRELHALRDVSFEVREGERLGVIGHNGAGKSTLLRVLGGVYRPTRGLCRVEGRVSALFDISLGFELDATGWENIFYRGYLQRQTPAAIRDRLDAIAEFSELGDALTLPVRYYSTGMLVRLAFSIATSIEPEILLLDEVLAAGDLAFHDKARRRMQELIRRARLMVLVSHDLGALSALCERVLWLDHGRVQALGPPDEVVPAYERFMRDAAAPAA
jgi:ABC-type polysaccharide/polyol phosphate transport system ATPase subunit